MAAIARWGSKNHKQSFAMCLKARNNEFVVSPQCYANLTLGCQLNIYDLLNADKL